MPKTSSYDAPASDKSEDLDEAEKRAADQVISDENPPSIDQDLTSKQCMSADEFSPPAPIDKHPVLSPIKSPQVVKSPAKRSYQRKSTVEKLQPGVNVVSELVKYGNTYDYIKNRERKTSQSKASPNLSDCDKSMSRKGRARKAKPKVKSQAYIASNSESDSDNDAVNTSHPSGSVLNSPRKSLPVSPQKSHPTSSALSGSAVCSTLPLTNSAKRKEAKQDRFIREQDSVRLKPDGLIHVPDKSTYCDSSKTASKNLHNSCPESIQVDEMLDSFTSPALTGSKPLSPIPYTPHIDDRCQLQTDENLKKVGLAVSTVKPSPLNGSISYNSNGKPSVLVKIDLNLLSNYLCLDRRSPNFLKPVSHESEFSSKHQKVTSAKSSLPNVTKSRKSQKVLNDTVHDRPYTSASKSDPNRTSPANSTSISSDKSSIGVKQSDYAKVSERTSVESRKSTTASVHVKKESESEIPDFDSLPVREPVQQDNPSDSESDSDSGSSSSGSGSGSSSSGSDSENEQDNSKAASESPAHEYDVAHHSPKITSPVDIKKRKLGANRPDDSKRRRTAGCKSPHKRSAAEISQR